MRLQRFKPVLFSQNERVEKAQSFFEHIEPYYLKWRAKEINDWQIVGFYWSLFLKVFRPNDHKVGSTKWAREYAQFESTEYIPLKYRLRSCPEKAHRAFYHWQKNKIDLVVTELAPSSEFVLNLQCQGRRLVTLIFDQKQFVSEIEGRDPLSFLLHDLVHADHFFFNEELKLKQIEFYRELRGELKSIELTDLLKNQPSFEKKLNYLISDMNSHPEHLRAYFNHIRVEAQSKLG